MVYVTVLSAKYDITQSGFTLFYSISECIAETIGQSVPIVLLPHDADARGISGSVNN